ncbi:MAG: intracellular septation protein [Candidatus Taylorbacteria bacterium]|nr:intracellular septation protein [Candidatus Taylorbacteria bacterium]
MKNKLILNLSIEFGPILAFLIASELLSFVKATAIFVALTAMALVVGYIERRELAWFPVIVSASIIGFGLLTIILDSPFFFIIKDTIYNAAFAIVLFTGLYFGHPLLKPLFKEVFSISDRGWKIMSLRWAVLFTLLTIANEIARISLTPDEWVIFKGFATVTTTVFAFYQLRVSKKERLPNATKWGLKIVRE